MTEPAPAGGGAAAAFAAAFLEIASSTDTARSWPFGHLRPTGYRRRFYFVLFHVT